MIELLLEPIIALIALVVQAVVLVLVWLPFGAIAGILARDISPDAFMWQATARVASVLLIVILAAVAVWPGVGSPAVWLICVGLGAVIFACGYVAEQRNLRQRSARESPAPAVERQR